MKVLLVNGGPHKEGCTYTALCEVAGAGKKYGVSAPVSGGSKKGRNRAS